MSVREVADALNLPARVIEALEADDYERLRPSVFTRGYLRSYARLLELPVDELLARYPEVTEEVEAVTETQTGTHAVVRRSRRYLGPVLTGIAVIVLVLVWLLTGEESGEGADVVPAPADAEVERGAQEETDAPAPDAAPGPAADTVSAPEPQPRIELPAEPVSEPASTETAGERSVQEAPAVEDEAPPEVLSDDGEEPAAITPQEAAGTVASEVRQRRITELGDDLLVMHFNEDCWVEVRSLDGENLYSDLNRAGQTLELTGRAPFRVLLGYAPGVSLEFNGEAVPLTRHSRNNVASLVLGQ